MKYSVSVAYRILLLLLICFLAGCSKEKTNTISEVESKEDEVQSREGIVQSKEAEVQSKEAEVQSKEAEGTFYIISDTIYRHSYPERIDASKENEPSKVTILDDQFRIVREIENYVAREYFQEINGDVAIELGNLENKSNNDSDFFGWYQASTNQWLLPCEFDNIEKYGDYYWAENDIGKYEIFDADFELVNSIAEDYDTLYYEDGTIRATKIEVLDKLIFPNSKEIEFQFSTVCQPKNIDSFLCEIQIEEDGFLEDYIYILNNEYEILNKQYRDWVGIVMEGNYYWCKSDSYLEYQYLCDLNGKILESKEGIRYNGFINVQDKVTYYGCQDDKLYFFDATGEELYHLNLNADELYCVDIAGIYENVVLIKNWLVYPATLDIYFKDKFLINCEIQDEIGFKNVQGYHKNEDYTIIAVGNRFICISEEGEIVYDDFIEGNFLAFVEQGFLTYDLGVVKLNEKIKNQKN